MKTVSLFAIGGSGAAWVDGRHHEVITRASWKRLQRLCRKQGKPVLPGTFTWRIQQGVKK